MSLELIAISGIVVLLVLMFLSMPLGGAMIMMGLAGVIFVVGFDRGLSMLGMMTFRISSNYVMSVIPLFILMGFLAADAGLSNDAFYAANKWLGHFPGGLAMAAIGGCAGFAAVCGNSVATAVTMCTIALPEMRKYKYADQFSLGAISCGGLLGWMIPPSIPFVIYSILTEVSVGSLFIAGILPGILITILFITTVYITCRVNPHLGPPGPKASWRERVVVLKQVWAVLLLFLVVLGGMYGGVFTATEAGAVGAFGAFVLALARRRLTFKTLMKSLMQTGALTGMIFLLIIGATVFNSFMAVTEIPISLAKFISGLSLPPALIMSIILVIYIMVGFFMDIMAVIVLSIPIFYPTLVAMGVDPVLFGVLIVLSAMIGNVTPPVGIVVFAVTGYVKDVPMFTIFRGIWPYLYAMVIGMIILIFIPQISLFLPEHMIAK